jgi:hypothetical protein
MKILTRYMLGTMYKILTYARCIHAVYVTTSYIKGNCVKKINFCIKKSVFPPYVQSIRYGLYTIRVHLHYRQKVWTPYVHIFFNVMKYRYLQLQTVYTEFKFRKK